MRYFHGIKYKKNVFEGWYFKHQKGYQSLSFIPSVMVDAQGKGMAILQILTDKKSWEFTYPLCEFNSEEEQLSIRMDNSFFTERGCTLNIKEEGININGRIDYGPLLMLDKDIMGPFRFLPKMECNHAVISLFHTCLGSIEINGEVYDFENGLGYIEMDWGYSFPRDYVWTHCSWKDEFENSIVVAAARIPYLGLSFKGCIGCLLYNQKQVVLATYFGAKIMQLSEDVLVVRQKDLRLEVHCTTPNPVEVKAPKKGQLIHHIKESLSCTVHYRLFEKNQCVLDKTMEYASFEAIVSSVVLPKPEKEKNKKLTKDKS